MINDKKGFTLIELMVVVAIIGVVSAIALPSYDSYMKKSRRSDAKVGLTKIVDKEERYYLRILPSTYTNLLDATGLDLKTATSATTAASDEGYYTLTVTAPTPLTGYTATATAVMGKAQENDTGCTVMTLNSAGVRAPAACW